MTDTTLGSADRRHWPLAGVTGIYACAFAVLAWPWLSGRVTIPWDAKSSFFTQQVFLARSLAQGQSPFWTPNVFAGWPQIADPQSLIFSPLHVLLALLMPTPDFWAVDAVTFASLFLGGLGIVLIFRERGWDPAAALVAALAFAFGGSCAARLQHTGQILSVAWLPLALWLTGRALERSSWRVGVLAGLFTALMALGRDQVALIGLYVLAGVIAAHWTMSEHPRQRMSASVKPLAAAALTGAIVIAIPMLMTALLALDSNRPAIDYAGAERGSLHPAHLLTFVFADLFGAADPTVPYWGPPSFPWGPVDLFLAQNMGQLYAGALPLVAIVVAGLGGRALWTREVRFFTIAALLVLFYALGRYTPAFRLIYELVPGVALFRRPADATFVLGMLFAVLGGYCVHRWMTDPPARLRPAWLLALALGIIAAAIAYALARSIGVTAVAKDAIKLAAVWMMSAGAALTIARRFAHARLLSTVLVAAFMTLDLAWNNAPNESTALPPAIYDVLRPDTNNETVALLKSRLAAEAAPDRRDRIELSGIGYHWPNASLVHGFDGLFGHNPLRLQDFAEATGVGDTVAVPDQRTFSPLFPSYRSPVAALFGLRYIATGVPIEQIDSSLAPGDLNFLARTADAYVYENPRALPRVMLLTEWRLAHFGALMREGWPEVDLHRTVLLERAPGTLASVFAGNPGAARIVRYANTEVAIEVDAPRGGILLLNDIWHPWWRASIDEVPAEIMKANVLFRAVAVPPGRHTVRFTFHPVAAALEELARKAGFMLIP
jgi:hypothetical protein